MIFNIQKYNSSKKQSKFEEFVSFLYDQKFNYHFRSFVYLPLNFNKVEEKVKLYNYYNECLMFVIEFENKPVIIYNVNEIENIVNYVLCIDKQLYKELLCHLTNNIVLSDIPMVERIE